MLVISALFWISLCLVLYTHVLYFFILYLLSSVKSAHRKIDEEVTPKISMVIAAYNEQDIIEDKILNFKQLNYPENKIELLIGSDGSDDRTNEIIKRYSNSRIRLFAYETRRGKASVLNDIVGEATGEILIFSDANTIYNEASLRKLVRYFADDNIGGVCGRLVLTNPNQNIGGKGEQLYWNYENSLKKLESKIKTVLGANGAIYALRKNLYTKLPEHKVIMDDFILPLRAVEQGYEVVYDDEAWATETTSPNIEGEFKRKIRIGSANFNALREIKTLLNPKRGFVAFGLWSHKILRWFVPFLLILVFTTNALFLTALFYRLTFVIQVVFYLSALSGYVLNRRGYSPKLLFYSLYFCAVNLALGIGFIKFLTRSQTPAWKRIDRS